MAQSDELPEIDLDDALEEEVDVDIDDDEDAIEIEDASPQEPAPNASVTQHDPDALDLGDFSAPEKSEAAHKPPSSTTDDDAMEIEMDGPPMFGAEEPETSPPIAEEEPVQTHDIATGELEAIDDDTESTGDTLVTPAIAEDEPQAAESASIEEGDADLVPEEHAPQPTASRPPALDLDALLSEIESAVPQGKVEAPGASAFALKQETAEEPSHSVGDVPPEPLMEVHSPGEGADHAPHDDAPPELDENIDFDALERAAKDAAEKSAEEDGLESAGGSEQTSTGPKAESFAEAPELPGPDDDPFQMEAPKLPAPDDEPFQMEAPELPASEDEPPPQMEAPDIPVSEHEPEPVAGLSPDGLAPDAETLQTLRRLAGADIDPDAAAAAFAAALSGEEYNVQDLPDVRTLLLSVTQLLIKKGLLTTSETVGALRELLQSRE